MKRLLFLSAALCILPTLSRAQAGNKWVQSVPDTGQVSYMFADIATDNKGNVYVTGDRNLNAFDADWYTVKYDSLGNQVWAYNFAPAGTTYNRGQKILVDAAGNTYVGGHSVYGSNVITLFKLDANGNFLWQDTVATQTASGSGSNWLYDMCFDASGNVIMVGSTEGYNVAGYPYMTVTKHAPNGTQLWINQTAVDYASNPATGVVTDANDNIYISGWENHGNPPNSRWVVRKYSPSGVIQWQDLYDLDPTTGAVEEAHDIGIDGAGDIYVGGFTNSGGNYDYLVRKYNTSGTLLWMQSISSAANGNDDKLIRMAVMPNGDVYLTGNFPDANDQNVFTAKLDKNGNKLWGRIFDRTYYDMPFAISADAGTGDVIVPVQTRRGNYYVDIATLKYTTNGDTVYQKVFPSYAQSYPRAGLVTSTGDVYVCGQDGNRGITMRIEDADAYLRKQIAGPGPVAFNNNTDTTAMTIDFGAGTGTGPVGVSFLHDAVANSAWCAGTTPIVNFSDYRWVINQNLDVLVSATLYISLDYLSKVLLPGFHGMMDPSKFSIYQRPIDGTGEFCKLLTAFANGVMSAQVTGFSEFFIGSETDTFNYYPVKVQQLTGNQQSFLQVYPNPATASAQLQFNLPSAATITLQITDVTGKTVVAPYTKACQAGMNILPVDVAEMTAGIYFIKMTAGANSYQTKLVVTH